ncbi:Fc receptor-like protein 5 [Lepisosteus oculatus]|uniref:Fc receptor-like protein 5 n=1 Tax=Lepisosteus oculatus TaxID=7918 RepID=UPI003713D9C0
MFLVVSAELPKPRVTQEPAWETLYSGEPVTLRLDPPKATLTLQPDWTVLFPAESLTMGCRLGGDSSRRQYSWYRVTAGGTESVQCQWENGTNCQVTFRDESHSGLYWCEAQSGQERSKSVHFSVLDQSLILQTPPQPLTEGQTLTLQCRERKSQGKRYEFYKDNEALTPDNGNTVTISAVKKRNEGLYRCQRSKASSQPVLISVRDLFSQVTLRASPGARVQEGEPVNLTCEAELTGYYSSPLSYSFFRDGQPVVEGSSSALYSMAKVNWTLTGSYSCVVEAEHRIRKNSAVTAVTLAVSWWTVARLAGGGSLCLISLCAVLMLHCRAQTSGETGSLQPVQTNQPTC